LGPGDLDRAIKMMPRQHIAGVLVGFENFDDAGVYQLTTDIAVVQTVDFFAPIVDDPYVYGQIAAVNALSDIYAMGGEPKTALSIVGFPTKGIDFSILGEIMSGGVNKLTEAGVALLGGHSVRDEEIKFGYSVTGTIDVTKMKQNNGAKIGDRLILTKPLGTGLITTAIKRDKAAPEHIQAAVATMLQLNQRAAEISLEFRVHAMTDITGFGLAGHASEIAKASHLSMQIDHSRLPVLPGALDYSRAGFCAGGLVSNEQFFGVHMSISDSVVQEWRNVLFDPQTSGGLLISCDPPDASALLNKLHSERIPAVEIGFTSTATDHLLTVK
jgi:selenide,water dikinase